VQGSAYTEETDFKQLVSCSVKLQLHGTGALSPVIKKREMRRLRFKQEMSVI
jgi:hypothetical protein